MRVKNKRQNHVRFGKIGIHFHPVISTISGAKNASVFVDKNVQSGRNKRIYDKRNDIVILRKTSIQFHPVVSTVDRTKNVTPIRRITLRAFHASIENTRSNGIDNNIPNICSHDTSSVYNCPMVPVVGRTENCAIWRLSVQD